MRHGVSPWLCRVQIDALHAVCPLQQLPLQWNMHMVTSRHPDLSDGRRMQDASCMHKREPSIATHAHLNLKFGGLRE